MAAAQPVAERETALEVRTDAEAYVVIDVSRSMLAKSGLDGTSRLKRAKAAAVQLRSALPEIPVGVASLTDRTLPHLFPSADADAFRATVDLALDIEQPPPRSSFITTATSFDSLSAMATQRFFSPRAHPPGGHRAHGRREPGHQRCASRASLPPAARAGRDLRPVLERDERVFNRGLPEPQYRPNPAARADLDALAAATDRDGFDESELDEVAPRVRSLLRKGPTVTEGVRKTRLALAPYLLACAMLPLGVLLWRRDR